MGFKRAPEECGATYGKRWPSAPSDEWETATCIQHHDKTPPPVGTVHDSGDGTRWVELPGFTELDEDLLERLEGLPRS
jgi:hypothetical protein